MREAFHLDIEKFRKAFADSAKADTNADNKTAVCADLFKPIRTWEELKQATRHATYGYIHGRAGKQEAEKWFGLKKQSVHELYKVAANAVKRAKDRGEKDGWVAPKAPNADVDRAPRDKKAPGEGSKLLSALNTLLNTDPEFTTALSYAAARGVRPVEPEGCENGPHARATAAALPDQGDPCGHQPLRATQGGGRAAAEPPSRLRDRPGLHDAD
ncbi:hypothetical protein PQR33_40470 [Paraburkholderia sediminicola]|uniref:hypothetical protein n=1 Tax=Paraburkholderia sediminicola TaxID=458836 RepID=UPI0038B8F679